MTVPEEDGEVSVPYTGTIATEAQGKQINATVLNFAKMNGFSKDLGKDKKRELKEAAKTALRPILIASLAPKVPAEPVPVPALATSKNDYNLLAS